MKNRLVLLAAMLLSLAVGSAVADSPFPTCGPDTCPNIAQAAVADSPFPTCGPDTCPNIAA